MKPLVIRDPVHDLIRIECQNAMALIETEPFQRLRRIKQLGLANLVYPGAEHSRFNHSLGVYHLVQRAMDAVNLNMGKEMFDKEQRDAASLTALLHDLGHGPFSHQFERFTSSALEGKLDIEELKHENWTLKIMKEHNEVAQILQSVGDCLVDKMKDILGHTYKPAYVVDLITSQLDMDRFDYLVRDSRFAGCQYGEIDYNWLFRSLLVGKKCAPKAKASPKSAEDEMEDTDEMVLAVEDKRGRNCVEQYLVGRHFMHIHLYYHKTIVAAEVMLEKILLRALECIKTKRGGLSKKDYPVLADFADGKNCSVKDYLKLDDMVVMGWVLNWARGGTKDKILEDLSRRLVKREVFARLSTIPNPIDQPEKYRKAFEIITKILEERKFNTEYYLIEVKRQALAHQDYSNYLESHENLDNFRDIHIVPEKNGPAKPLSSFPNSLIVKGKDALRHSDSFVFVPRECRREIEKCHGAL